MNYIELGFWGITALALVLGIIMGAVRGTNRSVLRLILVLVSVVAAFFLKDVLTNLILNIKVGENTLQQTIINALGEDFAEMGETVIIMVKVMASVLVFLVTFYLLKLLTWMIVYPLCKLFVKKGKKKHAIIGAVIGLVQGAVVALCICIPLGGFVSQTNKLMAAASEMQQQTTATVNTDGFYVASEDDTVIITPIEDATESDGGSTSDDGAATENNNGENPDGEQKGGFALPENFTKMMGDFENGFIGKFYSQTLKTPFNWIASAKVEVTDAEGNKTVKKYTLEGQVDAVVGAIHMMVDMTELKDIDWAGEFNGDVATSIKNVMDKLDATKGELSPEAIETINNAAGALLGSMDLPVEVDASKFDLNTVNFSKEGELIVNVIDVANKEEFTATDLKTITDDLAESTLVLPMVESITTPMTLDEKRKEQVERAFSDEAVKDCNPEILETLRNLFGLSSGSETPAE